MPGLLALLGRGRFSRGKSHLAKDSGILIPIEHEVIGRACVQVPGRMEDGHDLRVSVNVCAEQLRRHEDFENLVDSALTDSRLSAFVAGAQAPGSAILGSIAGLAADQGMKLCGRGRGDTGAA